MALPRMIRRLAASLVILVSLAACGETVSQGESTRFLVMGDSLLASNTLSQYSVSQRLEELTGEQVIDRSVVGASVLHSLPISAAAGLSISQQYRRGNWDWIILNGGGNDLWLGCGCMRCDSTMERLISSDGKTGEIVNLVSGLRGTGARIIYIGYLRSPGMGSPIEHCRDEGNELESRIARFAQSREGVYFLSLRDLVPPGDRSFHAPDMIHPSRKASDHIARSVYEIIQSYEK